MAEGIAIMIKTPSKALVNILKTAIIIEKINK